MAEESLPFEKQVEKQLEEQHTIRTKHVQTYQLLGALLVLAVGIWIGSQRYNGDSGFETNLYTEVLSIGVTVFILKWFDDRRETNRRKRELKLQLGSRSNDFALEAQRLLQMEEGWWDEALQGGKFPRADWSRMVLIDADLTDANLYRATLTNANLYRATLTNADLRWAMLTNANLTDATLTDADLRYATLTNADLFGATLTDAKLVGATLTDAKLVGATLTDAKLFGATLMNANLFRATLTNADLGGATLTNADLIGAMLTDADLQGATLTNARFNERTTLPDGTKWTPDTDMARFTDPEHPQFWRSDNPLSPAYRGRS